MYRLRGKIWLRNEHTRRRLVHCGEPLQVVTLVPKPKQRPCGTCGIAHLGPPTVAGRVSSLKPSKILLADEPDDIQRKLTRVQFLDKQLREVLVKGLPRVQISLTGKISGEKRPSELRVLHFGERPVKPFNKERKQRREVASIARGKSIVILLAIRTRPNNEARPTVPKKDIVRHEPGHTLPFPSAKGWISAIQALTTAAASGPWTRELSVARQTNDIGPQATRLNRTAGGLSVASEGDHGP